VTASTIAATHRETLRATDEYGIQRLGRFLVVELVRPSLVLSTSFINGGQSTNVRFLVNHQSCEAVAHVERHTRALEI
jgi:hypothetical protein